MKVVNMRLKDVHEGLVLGEDLYDGQQLLIRKGSVLTDRYIDLLKKHHLKKVPIRQLEREAEREMVSTAYIPKMEDVGRLYCEPVDYFAILAQLDTERRYGKVFREKRDIVYAQQLFEQYMENKLYNKLLNDLEQHDYYTFLHTLDVFTLCTMFAKEEGLEDLEELALGFLLHDIGKLKISPHLLRKKGGLTAEEFEMMKRHTTLGRDMLEELGLQSVAHMAQSHHEKADGTGYPHGAYAMRLPREVAILHLVDIYLAMTTDRAYKEELAPTNALTAIYKEKHLLDEDLLERFVNFLGIYPENAIVLLSNGLHVMIEEANNDHPLLPTVRRLDTNTLFPLPLDFQVKIDKLVTYYAEEPSKMLKELFDYLVAGEDDLMEEKFHQLTELYSPHERFSRIYMPMFKIYHYMKAQIQLPRLIVVKEKFRQFALADLAKLRKKDVRGRTVIFLMENNANLDIPLLLIEGMFYENDVYPFILNKHVTKEELTRFINYCESHIICSFGKEVEPVAIPSKELHYYHIASEELYPFIAKFAGLSTKQIRLLEKLEHYKVCEEKMV